MTTDQQTGTEIVLIDLSSIAYPIWHMSQSEPDPNRTSQQVVARVRALANGHPHVAICCDSGPSFRREVDPTYKANRPERDAPLQHQITLACEALAADGFPVWAASGFEADDLIGSAVFQALATSDLTVLIVSADKDLLQLVGPRVKAMSVRDGSILDEQAVATKFGVMPTQMVDYLTLVGDASDNIRGAKGIGPKTAAQLLAQYGSLDRIYNELDTVGGSGMSLSPAVAASLKDFKPRMATTRRLITLRVDAPIPFAQLANERVEKVPEFAPMDVDAPEEEEPPAPTEDGPTPTTEAPAAPVGPPTAPGPTHQTQAPPVTAMAVRQADQILPAPSEWERQLDPRSMRDARVLSTDMYESRMFAAYGTPQGILATIMVGRELGLPAMASLRCVWNIDGKHSLSASLMVALVLKSDLAEYFEPVSFSEDEATFETHRKGARNPVRLTHTFEMGRKAWPKTKPDWEKAFMASGWGRNPTDMLVARAQARLARMVYPHLLAGLYTPEELEEIRQEKTA